uniref:Uncharacterized protein n=1 Tax=Opuntia streptacantha TaxID=393608 RepID=A0A7C9F1S8_OPUST
MPIINHRGSNHSRIWRHLGLAKMIIGGHINCLCCHCRCPVHFSGIFRCLGSRFISLVIHRGGNHNRIRRHLRMALSNILCSSQSALHRHITRVMSLPHREHVNRISILRIHLILDSLVGLDIRLIHCRIRCNWHRTGIILGNIVSLRSRVDVLLWRCL